MVVKYHYSSPLLMDGNQCHLLPSFYI